MPPREGDRAPGATTSSPPGGPRFLADAMLVRLARWLRVLGYDTALHPGLDDRDLVSLAAAEDRIFLTRDRHLVTHLRPPRALLIAADAPMRQLQEVVAACGLALPSTLFTRCLVCNAELRPATPDEVSALVPERAREAGGPVLRCPGCARIYWPGSHVRRMRAALASAFPGHTF